MFRQKLCGKKMYLARLGQISVKDLLIDPSIRGCAAEMIFIFPRGR